MLSIRCTFFLRLHRFDFGFEILIKLGKDLEDCFLVGSGGTILSPGKPDGVNFHV